MTKEKFKKHIVDITASKFEFATIDKSKNNNIWIKIPRNL